MNRKRNREKKIGQECYRQVGTYQLAWQVVRMQYTLPLSTYSILGCPRRSMASFSTVFMGSKFSVKKNRAYGTNREQSSKKAKK